MNNPWEHARSTYRSVAVPEALSSTVGSALHRGNRQYASRRRARRVLSTGLAACACFVLLLNTSPSFAQAVEEFPVLGPIARIFTVREYQISDRDHLIDVRLPGLALSQHTDLEQYINAEIQARIDTVLDEAEQRAREAREAYVATGGAEEDFIPTIITVDYDIMCQNQHYLSFILTKTETIASAYTQTYTYNIDLTTGRELSLADLLGPDYINLANQAVREGIAQRLATDHDASYFDGSHGIEGFQSIAPDQKFYLNEAGNPVALFEKYEIAPGYMGAQAFEIPLG